jgi:hypothetical protein
LNSNVGSIKELSQNTAIDDANESEDTSTTAELDEKHKFHIFFYHRMSLRFGKEICIYVPGNTILNQLIAKIKFEYPNMNPFVTLF